MTTLFFILVAAVVLFIGYKFYQGYTKDKTIEVVKGKSIVPEGNPQDVEEPHGPKEQL